MADRPLRWRVDQQQAARLVADVLDIVRDARVPRQVIARPELDSAVALRHAKATADHDVMLVASSSCATAATGGRLSCSSVHPSEQSRADDQHRK